ncbi:GNAT family N-acetyltransferase [Burkholderia pseudomultivorans]|uniref:GNAT family N-acetyltransferase n=1 Tax=Burkholderia pseudomultivorans TaxID=1207504 RepID=UPI0009BFE624|nr:GNAT family N-acetyltransferase [Burkholderia pseudomultivorans]
MKISTERLTLRRWTSADVEPYASLSSDPDVTAWLGRGPISALEAGEALDQCEAHFDEYGFGLWAVERTVDGVLIGQCGLRHMLSGNHPMTPSVECSWRLARFAWGRGYMTEAARSALEDGFRRIELRRVHAWTSATNIRSRQVMQRIGMQRAEWLDFDHPALAADHPLRRHVVYFAER